MHHYHPTVRRFHYMLPYARFFSPVPFLFSSHFFDSVHYHCRLDVGPLAFPITMIPPYGTQGFFFFSPSLPCFLLSRHQNSSTPLNLEFLRPLILSSFFFIFFFVYVPHVCIPIDFHYLFFTSFPCYIATATHAIASWLEGEGLPVRVSATFCYTFT